MYNIFAIHVKSGLRVGLCPITLVFVHLTIEVDHIFVTKTDKELGINNSNSFNIEVWSNLWTNVETNIVFNKYIIVPKH